MKEYKVSYELRTDRLNKAGKCPIRLKITFKGNRTFKNTDFKIGIKDWDAPNESIRDTVANHNQMNYKLNDLKNAHAEESGVDQRSRFQRSIAD